jgi:hypothetical protein
MGRGYLTVSVRRKMGYPMKGYVPVGIRQPMSANKNKLISNSEIDNPDDNVQLKNNIDAILAGDLNESDALALNESDSNENLQEETSKAVDDYKKVDFAKIPYIWPNDKIITPTDDSPVKPEFDKIDKKFDEIANKVLNPRLYDFNQYSYNHKDFGYQQGTWAQAVPTEKLAKQLNELKGTVNDYLIKNIDELHQLEGFKPEKYVERYGKMIPLSVINKPYVSIPEQNLDRIQRLANETAYNFSVKKLNELKELNGDGKWVVRMSAPRDSDWGYAYGRAHLNFVPNTTKDNRKFLKDISNVKEYNQMPKYNFVHGRYEYMADFYRMLRKNPNNEQFANKLGNIERVALKASATFRQIEYLQNEMYKRTPKKDGSTNPEYFNQIINTKD